MRLLLDTHIAVWALLSPSSLLDAEREQMLQADSPPVLSAVAVWELRLKWQSFYVSGGRKGPVEPSLLVSFAAALDWEFLPLTTRHAAVGLAHPLKHKDPFDELLLVQAQEESLQFITRDSKLTHHPLTWAR